MLAEISSSEADTAVFFIIFPISRLRWKAILLGGINCHDGSETAAEALGIVFVVCGVAPTPVSHL